MVTMPTAITLLTAAPEIIPNSAEPTTAMALVQTIFGGLGAALFKLLILRVLLEIAVKLTRRSEPTGDVDEDGPGTD